MKRIGKIHHGWLLIGLAMLCACDAGAVVLWSNPGTNSVRNNGPGMDMLGGAIKRDDLSNDTLYFKFHVDPLSDETTEPYFAALELYEGDTERLGVGNALGAWAYSAFFNRDGMSESNHVNKYVDLRSARPELSASGESTSYQRTRRGVGVTMVFKVQYVPGDDDLVTVWLDPDLGPGATEVIQPETLTKRFNANATFNELRLRHGGNGDGWTFSDLAIANSFNDFVDVSSARPGGGRKEFIRDEHSLHFRSWLREQGLPHLPVRALTQTRDGYLWLGSDTDVARFDGLRFSSFGAAMITTNYPVRILFGDSRGGLWVGTANGGLKCWRNGRVTSLTTHDGLPSDSIMALNEDQQGNIWIGTEAGLMIWDGRRLTPIKSAESIDRHTITTLFKDRQGAMWLGVKGAGVFQLVADKLLPVVDGPLKDLLQDPHDLLTDQAGRLWVAAGDDAVLCRSQNGWQHYRIPKRLTNSTVSTLAEEPDGTIWAGTTGGGLFQFSEGKFSAVSAASKLAGSVIETLLVDRQGTLWVGTEEGLNQMQHKSLFILGQNEGLGFGPVQGIAQVSPDVIWAARTDDGLYRWDGRNFSRLRAAGLSAHNLRANAMLVTRDGVCWVASGDGLLRYKDPVAATDEVRWFELPGAKILALAEDRDGVLWVGTQQGKIWQLREGEWREQHFLTVTNPINAILPEADGSVWVGTEGGGLIQLTDGVPFFWGRNAGLASEAVRTLYHDAQGALWIGTTGGLSRWQDGLMATFTKRQGLPDDTISQILEDDAGRLWLGTDRGIACVSKQRLEELAAGKLPVIYSKVFNRNDGMPAEDCTGGFFPAGLKTRSGLLWFSTTNGIAVIAPQTLPAETLIPTAILEEILVDGISAAQGSVPKSVRIPPGKHRLELQYTALHSHAPETLRFRYQLEGWDADWVDAQTSRSAIYNFVPPGKYHFRVIACDHNGIWSRDEAELDLVFERHFWQSWWFMGVASVSLLWTVGGTVRVVVKQRMKRRLKRMEQERALEQERTRIAQDLHDEMGAKLCRISFLSEHARRGGVPQDDLNEQIKSISDDSREVLHSLDEIVWAVNPQNDTLEHVASYIAQYAQDYFQMTGIECEMEMPTQLRSHPVSSQIRHHLFLAVREALANILKHSGATNVKISMGCNDTRFEIAITDDGKGFDPATILKTEAGSGDSHDGLRNMTSRFSKLSGQCFIESAPGRGTTLKFILPLKSIPRPK